MTPRATAAGGEVLDRRRLNRALLARQMLLERRRMPVADALEHLVGLQAQEPKHPYIALWSRLDRFRTEDLARLIAEREAVRLWLMRTTIHLVTARDALALRGVIQPVIERTVESTWAKRRAGVEAGELGAAGRAIVDHETVTALELGRRLGERWPGSEPQALAQGVAMMVPLVQVPPRGLWGESGQARLTSIERWLGRPVDRDAAPGAMVLRYLAAFGPASVQDAQTWCGLTKLAAVFERLRPQLVTFRDEKGRELFDLPDAPRPSGDTPAPPRFLPVYDNVLLSHADRTRIVGDDHRRTITTPNLVNPGTFLVDGFVAGTWVVKREKGAATMVLAPLVKMAKRDREALVEEAGRLLALVAEEAGERTIAMSE